MITMTINILTTARLLTFCTKCATGATTGSAYTASTGSTTVVIISKQRNILMPYSKMILI